MIIILPKIVIALCNSFPNIFHTLFSNFLLSTFPVIADVNISFKSISSNTSVVYLLDSCTKFVTPTESS